MPNAYTVNEDMVLKRLENDAQRPFMTKLSTENLNTYTAVVATTHDRLTAFKHKKAPVLADRSKSEEGKATAVAQLAVGSLGDFKHLNIAATRETDTVARLRQDLITVKQPAGMDKAEAQGILNEYAGLTPQEKEVVFIKAAEDSSNAEDPEAQQQATDILWAFLTKRGAPMISPDIQRRGLEERARRLEPVRYAELEQAEIMAERLGGLRDHVALWLKGVGVDPKAVHDTLGGQAPAESPIEASSRQAQHA